VLVVSRFEANLLEILRGLYGRLPPSQVLPLMTSPYTRPPCLSAACIEAVQDTLAKGSVRLLSADGGWERERFLRAAGDAEPRVVEGRLWQRRHPRELGLAFSAHSLDFVVWLTSADLRDAESRWQIGEGTPLTAGDRLLLILAYQLVRHLPVGARWIRQSPWASDGLCQLMFSDDAREPIETPVFQWRDWLTEPGVAILESWQARLAARWLEMELTKTGVHRVETMRAIGTRQERVLSAFLDECDRAGRRDLARFLLVVARRLLTRQLTLRHWIGGLSVEGLRLADRLAAYQAALALLRQLDRLSHWQRQALGVGYFDEGYAAAQLWKADWEAYNGDQLCEAARSILRQAEPLSGAPASGDEQQTAALQGSTS
jgi:hypothetical protein